VTRIRVVLVLAGYFLLMGGLFVAANGGWW
jgi:hypothetical protein